MKGKRPINFHAYAHWDEDLDYGSRERAEVAVYLDSDMIREDVRDDKIVLYASHSGHVVVPTNIPPHYILNILDVKNHLMIYSRYIRDKYTQRALQCDYNPDRDGSP